MAVPEWDAACALGVYDGAEHDRRDGFLHLSAAGQVAGTLAAHYAGRTDLVLAEIDAGALGGALVWEPSRGGALFPHLYGTLPVAAVLGVVPVPLDGDGRHALPPALAPGSGRGSGPESEGRAGRSETGA